MKDCSGLDVDKARAELLDDLLLIKRKAVELMQFGIAAELQKIETNMKEIIANERV